MKKKIAAALRQPKYQLLAILTLAAASRFILLDKSPFLFDGDAAKICLEGIKVWQQRLPFWETGWYGQPHPYLYLVGAILRLIPNRLVAIRLLSALGGTLAIAANYFWVGRFFGKKNGLWASLFLTTLPFHLVFSRNGMEVVWTTFFIPLVLCLVAKKEVKLSFLAGLALGVSQYFGPAMRLLPILIIGLYSLLLIAKKVTWRKTVSNLLILLFGLLLTYGNMTYHYFKSPGGYTSRIQVVGIIQSGWLKNKAESQTLTRALWRQVANNFLVFHLPVKTFEAIRFYRVPFLELTGIVFFTIGLIVGLKRIRSWQYLFLFFYFFTGVVLAGVMTTVSPSASRHIAVLPAVAAFTAIGISSSLKLLKKDARQRLSIGLILLMIASGAFYYTKHDRWESWRHDINNQVASTAGRYFYQKTRQKEKYRLYFVGNKLMDFYSVPSLLFLSQQKGVNLSGPIDINQFDTNQINYFIVLTSQKKEIKNLQRFPSYQKSLFYNPYGKLLFYLVKI